MTYFIQPIITKNGANKIAEAIASKKPITFTRIALGKGAIKTNIENATDVASLVHTLSVAQSIAENDPNVVRVFGRLDNTDINTELNITEIGVFAKVEGTAEFMFMYTWAENGDIIPPASVSKVYRDYDFATTISKDAPVVIKFENDGVVYATEEELQTVKNDLIKKIDNMKIDDATLTSKGIVQLTNDLNSTDTKKVPNGKTLGDLNRKLESHTGNATKHITSSERTKWNGKADLNFVDAELNKKADKTVAQMWKLTKDDGNVNYISDSDLDDIVDTGHYKGQRLKNSPFGDVWQYIDVVKGGSGTKQVATTEFNRTAFRALHGGVWEVWTELATTKITDKKADIDKAQMYKLTKDDGNVNYISDSDLDDIVDTGHYKGQRLKNSPFGDVWQYIDVVKGGSGTKQVATTEFNRTAFRALHGGVWEVWTELANTNDITKMQNTLQKAINLKANTTDLTKATTVQLASGNNLNDYFDHNGKIAGINLVGAPLEMNGHNVIVECSSYTNTGSTQEITDLVTGVKMLRTYTSGRWTRWQKLGGIDAKIYDIVMTGGIKPSKYATGYDNKIVVYDGVAHLSLNLDTTNVRAPKITIPKELAIQLKSTHSSYDGVIELNSATANYGLAYQDGRRTLRVTNKKLLGETNDRNMLYLTTKKANVKWTNATVLDVAVNGKRLPNHVGYFSWYVGGVN